MNHRWEPSRRYARTRFAMSLARWGVWALFASSGLATATACGRLGYGSNERDAGIDAGAEDAPSAGPTLEEFLSGLAQRVCELEPACQDPARSRQTVVDCTRTLRAELIAEEVPRLRESEALGRFRYDASLAAECLAALDCDLFSHGLLGICARAVHGLVPRDGGCDHFLECSESDWCRFGPPGTCPRGRCVPRRPLDAPCEPEEPFRHASCLGDLRCALGTCHVPASEGAPCTSDDACVHGLLCAGAGGSRVCTTLADVYASDLGEPCDTASMQLCAPGLSCPFGPAQRCVVGAASGAACAYGIPDPCPLDEVCEGMPGRCAPLPGEGEPCLGTGAVPCQPGTLCAGTTCQTPREEGRTCDVDMDCYPGATCSSGACTAPPLCGP